MHWFFRYLIARESYRLINKNRATISSSVGRLFRWLVVVIFHALMLLLMIGLTANFASPPEQRWLRHFIALLLIYLLLIYLLRTVGFMFTSIRAHNRAVDQLARQSTATQAEADQLLDGKQQLQRSMQAALGRLILGLLALLVVGGYMVYLYTS